MATISISKQPLTTSHIQTVQSQTLYWVRLSQYRVWWMCLLVCVLTFNPASAAPTSKVHTSVIAPTDQNVSSTLLDYKQSSANHTTGVNNVSTDSVSRLLHADNHTTGENNVNGNFTSHFVHTTETSSVLSSNNVIHNTEIGHQNSQRSHPNAIDNTGLDSHNLHQEHNNLPTHNTDSNTLHNNVDPGKPILPSGLYPPDNDESKRDVYSSDNNVSSTVLDLTSSNNVTTFAQGTTVTNKGATTMPNNGTTKSLPNNEMHKNVTQTMQLPPPPPPPSPGFPMIPNVNPAQNKTAETTDYQEHNLDINSSHNSIFSDNQSKPHEGQTETTSTLHQEQGLSLSALSTTPHSEDTSHSESENTQKDIQDTASTRANSVNKDSTSSSINTDRPPLSVSVNKAVLTSGHSDEQQPRTAPLIWPANGQISTTTVSTDQYIPLTLPPVLSSTTIVPESYTAVPPSTSSSRDTIIKSFIDTDAHVQNNTAVPNYSTTPGKPVNNTTSEISNNSHESSQHTPTINVASGTDASPGSTVNISDHSNKVNMGSAATSVTMPVSSNTSVNTSPVTISSQGLSSLEYTTTTTVQPSSELTEHTSSTMSRQPVTIANSTDPFIKNKSTTIETTTVPSTIVTIGSSPISKEQTTVAITTQTTLSIPVTNPATDTNVTSQIITTSVPLTSKTTTTMAPATTTMATTTMSTESTTTMATETTTMETESTATMVTESNTITPPPTTMATQPTTSTTVAIATTAASKTAATTKVVITSSSRMPETTPTAVTLKPSTIKSTTKSSLSTLVPTAASSTFTMDTNHTFSNQTKSESGLSSGAWTGIAMAGLVGFWVILGPVVCCLCRLRDKGEEKQEQERKRDSINQGLIEQMIFMELARGREKIYKTSLQDEREIEKLNNSQNSQNSQTSGNQTYIDKTNGLQVTSL